MTSIPPTLAPTARAASGTTRRRAFTLLELLVVFTVIAVLVGVALMVGQKVTGGSKIKSTQNVLQALDQAVTAYTEAKGGTAARFPDKFIDATTNRNEFPLADATIGPAGPLVPSGELAVEVMMKEPASAAILRGIPAEYVQKSGATAIGTLAVPQSDAAGNAVAPVVYTRIKDSWGRPIRFVHPSYQGIYGVGTTPARSVSLKQNGTLNPYQLSRQWAAVPGTGGTTYQGDGDGGLCAGGRPYFYSAGPDGNPATVEDNVYSIRPTFDAAVKAGGQ